MHSQKQFNSNPEREKTRNKANVKATRTNNMKHYRVISEEMRAGVLGV